MIKIDKSKLKEEDHQKMLVKYLEIQKQMGNIIEYFAPMNENKQSFSNRAVALKVEAKAKAMGKKTGVSDLCIILKNRVVFIEMKKAPKKLKSGKLSYTGIIVSDYQNKFIETVKKSNVCGAVVCYGFDEAKNFIDIQIQIDKTKRLENE